MRYGRARVATMLALALGFAGCARVSPPPAAPPVTAGWSEEGVASWYGDPFHGRLTASGEVYDMDGMTAAHRTLPFGTVVQVRNLANGLVTTVRINDRGPFVRGRHIDLSRSAARELDMIRDGTARVRMIVVDAPESPTCWVVQVGAFVEERNAEDVRRRLEPEGHPVRVFTADDGLHRVRVGPVDSHAEAEAVARRAEGMVLECPAPL